MYLQKPPLGTQLDWSNPLNKGVVMHLAMNEGHGDKVQDLSMNGNHGTLNNFAYPPTVASGWNPGRAGVGLNFDGTDDYIYCGNDASLDVGDKYTISVWVKAKSWTNYDRVWGKMGTPGAVINRISLFMDPNGTLTSDMRIGSAWYYALHTDVIALDEWNYIVVTIDNINQQAKIYQNGILKDTDTGFTMADTLEANLILGALTTTQNHGNINLDQVRVHDRAQTAKEVMDYYINPWQVYLDEDD